jgi:formylglycine-generating enzyme required for sulfatase activity
LRHTKIPHTEHGRRILRALCVGAAGLTPWILGAPACSQGASAGPGGHLTLDASADGHDGNGGCTPASCGSSEAECGDAPDGCGGVVHCGQCTAGHTCGAGGPNRCGTGSCTPKVCQPGQCGWVSDGCAAVLDCGACGAHGRHAPNDFDGDGKSDLALFCPATEAVWYVLASGGTNNASDPHHLGTYDSIPVTGDYDGDGVTDFAVFRSLGDGKNALWEVHKSSDGTTIGPLGWGSAGAIPAPADFDGDGKTDMAVYLADGGRWYIMFSATNTTNADNPIAFGYPGARPAGEDYNGDGQGDYALYDRALLTWHVMSSKDASGIHAGTQFGAKGDIPAPGDYDGDGRADLALFRPTDGTWHIWRSGDGVQAHLQFGSSRDFPVPGDYDGDGKSDLALYRRPRGAEQGQWFVRTVAGTTLHDGTSWGFGQCRALAPVEVDPDGFMLAPAGTFQMGVSPGDTPAGGSDFWGFEIEHPHEVTLTRDFWIKATEVTQSEWEAITGGNPSSFPGCGHHGPVDNVSWKQAAAFCNALSAREALVPCYYQDDASTVPYDFSGPSQSTSPRWPNGLDCEGYRLPTEAEWEYAARATSTTALFNGPATAANLEAIGWYAGNSACSYAGCDPTNYCDGVNMAASGPRAAASKAPNLWGLYDTAGNAWEFVWDFFGKFPDGSVADPIGPEACTTSTGKDSPAGFHVARGGSWMNEVGDARVSRRDGDDNICQNDNSAGPHVGFRVARTRR